MMGRIRRMGDKGLNVVRAWLPAECGAMNPDGKSLMNRQAVWRYRGIEQVAEGAASCS